MFKTVFFIFFTISFCSFSVFAKTSKKEKHEHREHSHKAHVHGGGQLSIAFDNNNGKIEFRSSADSILGFEKLPSKNNKKQNMIVASNKFEKEISQMLQFDSDLACVFNKEKIEQVFENLKTKKHSDWVASYTVQCKKSPLNSQLKIDFIYFKNLFGVVIIICDLLILLISALYKLQQLTLFY